MITDDLLERGLGTIGDGYGVPPRAIDDILGQLRPAEAAEPEDGGVGAVHGHWPSSRRTWLLSSAAAIVVLVIVAFVIGGNSASNSTTSHQANTSAGVKDQAAPPEQFATASGGNGSAAVPMAGVVGTAPRSDTAVAPQSAAGSKSQVAPTDSLTKIERTGELDLQVDKIKVNDAVNTLTRYATQVRGIVASSQMLEGDGAPSATVTLRVPNSSFDVVLGQARGLGKVLSLQTKTADVTAQYVDLGARLHALGLTKQTYLNILQKATTIGQILSVQQQINDIQTQIDQLQGQLKVLNDRTTYATLTVSIDQKSHVKAAVVHQQSGLSKAVHRSVSRFVHGIEAIIGAIGPIVLVLLLIGLGWLLAKVGYRIVRRQMV
ncbi:MAG: hypothetical protein QOC82_1384 [Frankiaceae bacterium]|nr:hypothetical protein [Frankiaceae bacterium]